MKHLTDRQEDIFSDIVNMYEDFNDVSQNIYNADCELYEDNVLQWIDGNIKTISDLLDTLTSSPS